MEVNKLEGKTLDGVSENVSVLAQAFPEVIVDGKVDFEKLRLLLGEDIEDAEERYSFTWPGKRDAIKLAISRTTGTLRPDKENSKDWDTTQNLFLEGDNLEVLRVLQNTYRGKVKMIYIDPPYNTGKDFVYKDDFKDNIANYKEQAGLEGQSNADTSGRYHTNWLNMMYPRLRLAKNLLKKDGVIFISIDDHEVHNLRKTCDEIFGEDSFIAQLPRSTTNKGKNDEQLIAASHDYVLIYSGIKRLARNSEFESQSRYKLQDKKGRYYAEATLDSVSLPYSESLDFEINFEDKVFKPIVYNGKKISWRWSKDLVQFGIENDLIVNKNGRLYTKTYLEYEIKKQVSGKYELVQKEIGGTFRSQMLMDYKFSNNEASRGLIGLGVTFDYTKPVSLVLQLMKLLPDSENEIILDFFAGSSTTAHAVIQQNAEDSGNRRFIMVQIPEIVPEQDNVTLSQISRKRIDNAGEKIKADYADKLKERTTPFDVGFKAFKLDTTNFREWDTDTEDINASLLAALDTFKEGRTSEDALYEVLLKYGVDLTEPVEVLTLDGKHVYSLAGNYLLVCLEKHISLATVEEIAKLKPARVVCYDDGFENDEVKQNALETLKRAGVEDVRVI